MIFKYIDVPRLVPKLIGGIKTTPSNTENTAETTKEEKPAKSK